ncbi:MAG: hypothetical protein H0W86_00880 [Armatimonadetes bacterium]|nr:hypothetical protein [Armatimonadota bacterium]
MELLRYLTICYAAVLVLALAAVLITILIRLVQIGGVLKDIVGGLTVVKDQTSAMPEDMEKLLRPITVAADYVTIADEEIEKAMTPAPQFSPVAGGGR